jgi:hypothetical protein
VCVCVCVCTHVCFSDWVGDGECENPSIRSRVKKVEDVKREKKISVDKFSIIGIDLSWKVEKPIVPFSGKKNFGKN